MSKVQLINADKVTIMMEQLEHFCAGPSEAYGLLCAVLVQMNFECNTTPVTLVEFAEEVAETIRSMREVKLQ